MGDRPDHAREIKHALVDVRSLCEQLGLLAGKGSFQRQANGLVVRCLVHEDRTPSCSVQVRGGVILWKCHGCGAEGDALTLVALARGLGVKRDFREVLRIAAEIAGLWSVVQEIDAGGAVPPRSAALPPPAAEPEPDRDYPPAEEVERFWGNLALTSEDVEVSSWIRGRGLDPDAVDGRELARALPRDLSSLPQWAVCRGGTWAETGYRMIVPMYGPMGEIVTVRAGRVVEGEGPKRRPPFGHKASGVVMADGFGVAMLRARRAPERIVVCEGEPDFLTWATRTRDAATAVLAIVAGSWTAAMTARLPLGAMVIVRTDADAAGDRYAAEIIQSVKSRCFVRRVQ